MDKRIIYAIIGIMLLTNVVGLSDPINQTLTEYNNMTKTDNILEFTQELNSWVGGLFGIVFLIIIFAASFTVGLFFNTDMSRAALFSMFITMISSVFLYISGLVPDTAMYFSVPIFLIVLVYNIVSR